MMRLKIAGVDEAGRGPLAGPVFAAVVILPTCQILGLADSKRLTVKKREQLYNSICEQAVAFSIGRAEHYEIDELNILQATLLAMQRAVEALSVKPDRVLVDGLHCPSCNYPTRAIIRGDRHVAVISAASIVAKVSRDEEMQCLDQQYPNYGFAQHKGYPTMAHLQALRQYGASPIHRKSFAPVRRLG